MPHRLSRPRALGTPRVPMGAIRIPRRLVHTVSAAGIAVSIGACSDTLSPPPAAPRPAGSEERASSVDENEFNYVARFRVRGSVQGSLRPGGTIQVSANIAANFATRDAEVRILAPEASLLRAGRYTGEVRLTGLTVAPEVSTRATFGGPGQARALGATLTIGEPGYYRVLVAALAPNDAPGSDDGATMIQNAVFDEIWFTVTPEGGRVTDLLLRDDSRPRGGVDILPRHVV